MKSYTRNERHRRRTQRNQLAVVVTVSIVFALMICNCCIQVLTTNATAKTTPPETYLQNSLETEDPIITEDVTVSIQSVYYDSIPSAELTYREGHTTAKVNLRENPSTNSNILEVLPVGYNVTYTDYNEEWYQVETSDSIAYLHRDYVAEGSVDYKTISLSSSGFKSFMGYRAITNTSSKQYKIQDQYAYTGTFGIRQVDGKFCVALGSAVNVSMGTYVDLVLENGTIINCILADQKDDIHTLDDNLTTAANGCVSEFIVDTSAIPSLAAAMGDISYSCEDWQSPVSEIHVYDFNIFD